MQQCFKRKGASLDLSTHTDTCIYKLHCDCRRNNDMHFKIAHFKIAKTLSDRLLCRRVTNGAPQKLIRSVNQKDYAASFVR